MSGYAICNCGWVDSKSRTDGHEPDTCPNCGRSLFSGNGICVGGVQGKGPEGIQLYPVATEGGTKIIDTKKVKSRWLLDTMCIVVVFAVLILISIICR